MDEKLLQRALAAKRDSRRVAFRRAPASEEEWSSFATDAIAIANSGGGVIVVDSPPDSFGDRLPFNVELQRVSDSTTALFIDEARTPIVSEDGTLYVRHGGKSERATTEDIAAMIDRRVNAARKEWLSAVRTVVRSRKPSVVLPPEVRDSESPTATPIRVVDDPNAPAYRVVDPDKTHPFRRKEVLATLQARLPDRRINQFDMQAIRKLYDIDAKPEFSHKSLFGTRQYSQKFIDWLLDQAARDPAFFDNARQQFLSRIKRARQE